VKEPKKYKDAGEGAAPVPPAPCPEKLDHCVEPKRYARLCLCAAQMGKLLAHNPFGRDEASAFRLMLAECTLILGPEPVPAPSHLHEPETGAIARELAAAAPKK
jgi:hypothetical protein